MPAPGARCPECILARSRDRQLAGADLALAKSPEEAQARDRALLDLLQHGPAGFERLAAVIPGDFVSDEARAAACRSSLLRMKVKKVIQIVPEGYARV